MTLKYAKKCIFGRGCAPETDPAGGAHNTPPDPIVSPTSIVFGKICCDFHLFGCAKSWKVLLKRKWSPWSKHRVDDDDEKDTNMVKATRMECRPSYDAVSDVSLWP